MNTLVSLVLKMCHVLSIRYLNAKSKKTGSPFQASILIYTTFKLHSDAPLKFKFFIA